MSSMGERESLPITAIRARGSFPEVTGRSAPPGLVRETLNSDRTAHTPPSKQSSINSSPLDVVLSITQLQQIADPLQAQGRQVVSFARYAQVTVP